MPDAGPTIRQPIADPESIVRQTRQSLSPGSLSRKPATPAGREAAQIRDDININTIRNGGGTIQADTLPANTLSRMQQVGGGALKGVRYDNMLTPGQKSLARDDVRQGMDQLAQERAGDVTDGTVPCVPAGGGNPQLAQFNLMQDRLARGVDPVQGGQTPPVSLARRPQAAPAPAAAAQQPYGGTVPPEFGAAAPVAAPSLARRPQPAPAQQPGTPVQPTPEQLDAKYRNAPGRKTGESGAAFQERRDMIRASGGSSQVFQQLARQRLAQVMNQQAAGAAPGSAAPAGSPPAPRVPQRPTLPPDPRNNKAPEPPAGYVNPQPGRAAPDPQLLNLMLDPRSFWSKQAQANSGMSSSAWWDLPEQERDRLTSWYLHTYGGWEVPGFGYSESGDWDFIGR